MTRSFLALLRGSDGRSLARALGLLVFLNAIIGSVHAGAMAGAPAVATVLCVAAASSDTPAPIGDIDDYSCCVLGCAPSHAIAISGAAELDPPLRVAAPSDFHAGAEAPSRRHHPWPSPRGPPVLA